MTTLKRKRTDNDGTPQKHLENKVLRLLEKQMKLKKNALNDKIPSEIKFQLDGYCSSRTRPISVEVYSHLGTLKAGQVKKVGTDMAKLVLMDKLLHRKHRKIIALTHEDTALKLSKSWLGSFAEVFDIEIIVVSLETSDRASLKKAQNRQSRAMTIRRSE